MADEPTAALDKATSDEIMEVMKSLNSIGKTIVIVTHDRKRCIRDSLIAYKGKDSVISISDSVTSICNRVFAKCNSLTLSLIHIFRISEAFRRKRMQGDKALRKLSLGKRNYRLV